MSTATLAASPEPTRSDSFEALLAPGPTTSPPEGMYFQMGADIWYQRGSEDARRIITNTRIGPWAQTSDGNQLAMVRYRDEGDEEIEEIVLVDVLGTIGAPVYGPVTTSGTPSSPKVLALEWSLDGQALGLLFDNGTIWTMRFAADDPFRTKPPIEPVDVAEHGAPTTLSWAPSGAGIAYTTETEQGSALYVTPNDDPTLAVVSPTGNPPRSVSAFAWLPGRGRIVFVEATNTSSDHRSGSIFTVAPDGTLPELLVSAGQFAPAATISTLRADPDGRDLAFTVHVPNSAGQQVFQSLWVLSIDSGELHQVPIETGYQAVDVTWVYGGLVWRGIDRNARMPTDGRAYSVDAPFILVMFDTTATTSSVIFQSTLVE